MSGANASTQELRYIVAPVADETNALAFSPDGRLLASGSDDHTIRLWDVASRQPVRALDSHADWVRSVAWSPDGTTLASSSDDRTIRLWEAASGRLLAVLMGHAGTVSSVVWSPDGTKLASSSYDQTLRLWDVPSGQPLAIMKGHDDAVRALAWSADGAKLASASDDRTVRLWDAHTGQPLFILRGHGRWVKSVAWSPAGTMVASGSGDQTLRLWDAHRGTLLRTLTGHVGELEGVAWSPDGQRLASCSGDRTVRVWDAQRGTRLTALSGHAEWVTCVAWSPDSRTLASGSCDATIRLWNAESGELLAMLQGQTRGVNHAAWSRDGTRLASGSDDQLVRLWDVAGGSQLAALPGHRGGINHVEWSPDGARLASASDDQTVRLWDAQQGTLLRTLQGHGQRVVSVTWSPDGTRLASTSDDQTIRLWDAGTGKPLATLEGHTAALLSAAWSPDGTRLASSADDDTVRLWDVATGRLLATLEGHARFVMAVAWSPDGTRLASGAGDRTVKIWDAQSCRLLQTLEGHTHTVICLAWSPDGTVLVSGAWDYTARQWDATTWELLDVRVFVHPGHHLQGVAFAPPGPVAWQFRSAELDDTVMLAEKALPSKRGQSSVAPSARVVSAKIVLVGESGVGKSGLALRLAEDRFEEQVSTHGMRVWRLPYDKLYGAQAVPVGEQREIVLWDLGGQEEYRLVHQLFLHDTTLALILLDPTRDRHYQDVEEWNLRLAKQLRGQQTRKLLVGTRSDLLSGQRVDSLRIEATLKQYQMSGFSLTSAKQDTGVAELRAQIAQLIDWDQLSRSTRPQLWQRIGEVIEQRRRQGRIVVLHSELETELRALLLDEYDGEAFDSVLGQLACQGAITATRLVTGQRALILQIGYVEIYAGALVRLARDAASAGGVPALELADCLYRKSFPGISAMDRLADPLNERSVLECVIELMIEHGLCFSHERLLIFPSLFQTTTATAEAESPYAVSLCYEFSGALDNIYSSLVTMLAVSKCFGRVRLWKDRAEFEHPGQGACALRRYDRPGGWSHLDLSFSAKTAPATSNLFKRFVEDHLQKEGVSIREVLEMKCPRCSHVFEEPLLRQRIQRGHEDINCPLCDLRCLIHSGAKNSDPQLLRALIALRKTIADRKHSDIEESKRELDAAREYWEPTMPETAARAPRVKQPEPVRILHLSDLHFTQKEDPLVLLQPLLRDLRDREGGLGLNKVDFLVVSGDLTQRAAPAEFERAYQFISSLAEELLPSGARVVLTPGNHDLSWDTPVYTWQPRRMVDVSKLEPGSYSEQGKGYLVRDDDSYPKRWQNFDRFYHQLRQQPYPLKPEEQCRALFIAELGIQFLELNSAWQIDEHNRERSSINARALASGLITANRELAKAVADGRLDTEASVFRIAVWHHPATGNEKIADDAFLEQLRQEGFKLCLHGHVHQLRTDVVAYLHPRRLHVAGAGSFGAPMAERPESTPRLYNLLELARDHSKLRVHTRCLRNSGGAWEGWANWPDDDPTKRRTYYEIRF